MLKMLPVRLAQVIRRARLRQLKKHETYLKNVINDENESKVVRGLALTFIHDVYRSMARVESDIHYAEIGAHDLVS
jgi:hypothetical protein